MEEKPESKTLKKFTDEEIHQLVASLEETYPHLNRMKQGYKLIGFEKNKNSGEVPVWYYHGKETRYTGAHLRALRKERGVGAKENKVAKKQRLKDRLEALDELVRVSEEMGLYETTQKNPLDKSSEIV